MLNTIRANMRTEELLEQSQSLTQELQKQSEELRNTNDELQEKARLLSEQNRDIEIKNEEIELARRGLEDKAAQLALSSKYKSEFLANMSHELRTPLNSMLILTRLLAENEDGVADRRARSSSPRRSTRAGNDLLSLINDILDLSKVEAGRMEVDMAPVALSDIYEDAERAFRQVAEQKEPRVHRRDRSRAAALDRLRRAAARPDPEEPALERVQVHPQGRGDAGDRHAPDGDGVLAATRCAAAEHVISFSVTDTGVGIPDDKLAAIFEAFQQADGTTSRKYGGTGLGLSISREIARLLGGEIQVESHAGRGQQVLAVPAAHRAPGRAGDRSAPGEPALGGAGARQRRPPPVARGAARRRRGAARARRPRGAGDRLQARRARALLEAVHAHGAQGRGRAPRPTAALGLAREHRPGAVLLAGDMPRVESVLGQLKKHPDTRHVPVVMIGDPAARIDALRAGAAVFIEDPVDDGDARARARRARAPGRGCRTAGSR